MPNKGYSFSDLNFKKKKIVLANEYNNYLSKYFDSFILGENNILILTILYYCRYRYTIHFMKYKSYAFDLATQIRLATYDVPNRLISPFLVIIIVRLSVAASCGFRVSYTYKFHIQIIKFIAFNVHTCSRAPNGFQSAYCKQNKTILIVLQTLGHYLNYVLNILLDFLFYKYYLYCKNHGKL